MAYRYGHPIDVVLDAAGEPAALELRGRRYHVLQIFSRWLLRERRWDALPETPDASPAGVERYFRLACDGDLLCEVYFSAADDRWILDRVLDLRHALPACLVGTYGSAHEGDGCYRCAGEEA